MTVKDKSFCGPAMRLAVAACLFAGCAGEPVPSRVAFTSLVINGHPVHMVLDTGAASTLLYNSAANRLGLKFASPGHDVIPGEFEIVTGMSEKTTVTLGDQTVTTRIPVFTLSSTLPREDGVVGWPEIRDNILVFDAARRTVHRVDQLPAETSGWLKLKIRRQNALLLETPLGDRRNGSILVDTGAPQGVQLTQARWNEFKAAHPNARATPVDHSAWSIGSFTAETLLADTVSLGTLVLTNVQLENMPAAEAAWLARAAPDDEVLGVIGMVALSRLDLIVDGNTGFAYLHPKPQSGSGNWSVADDMRLHYDSLLVRSGIDYCSSNNFDPAIAEYTRALELNPRNSEAYANRALAQLEKGDVVDAVADDNRAVELDPKNPDIYAARALARQIHGDFFDALNDYDKVIELSPQDSVNAQLQRQTLLRRVGRPAEDFSSVVAGWKRGWTKSIGMFVADLVDERALLAAVEKKDSAMALNEHCEAFYYIGLKRLCNGDKAGARDYFQKSVATGVREYTEYQFAVAELARLDAEPPPPIR